MQEISQEMGQKAKAIKMQLEETKRELYRVLVQDEYVEYFTACAAGESALCKEEGGLSEMAKQFSNQVKMIYGSVGIDRFHLGYLCRKYHRDEYSVTVAYEQISDEDLEKLCAEDIVTIYMGEIYHQRWGGVWEALFKDPFFLRSLKHLKKELEKETPAKRL